MNLKDFVEHPAVCALPWTGIYVNPDGTIKNCAISKEKLGNLHDSTVLDLLNNDTNQRVRQDMLDGVRHARCTACYGVEDNAENKILNESNRTWYKKIAIKNKIDLDIFNKVDTFQPMVLDLRWRNTCNRACIYCGPDLSSLWETMMDQDYTIDDSVLDRSKKYIFENLHTVKHVYLAGGEPLLIKENQLLLEKLLEINPDVDIRINSNIGNIKNPVFALLKKFSNVKWTISVDSRGDSFEYIRWPGKWNEFLNNLDEVRSIAQDNINFNMVWCILNDEEILDTIDFFMDRGFHENAFIVQCLSWPEPLSVLNLPLQHRLNLKEKILQKQSAADPNYWLYKSLSSMYNFLDKTLEFESGTFFKKIPMKSGLAGTFQFLSDIDAMRNTSSETIFKRLYQYK